MGGRGSASRVSKGVAAQAQTLTRQATSIADAPMANYKLGDKKAAYYNTKAFDYEIERVEKGIKKEVWATKDAIAEYRDKIKGLRENLKKFGNTKEARDIYKEIKTKEVTKIKKQIKRLQFIKKSNSIYDIEKVLNDKRLTSYKNPRG